MKLGAHVSAAGGLHLAPARAAELGLECFQFFSRSPQGGPAPALTDAQITLFLEACAAHGFDFYCVHAPYIINLASPEERIRTASVEIMRQELARCAALSAASVVMHLGSAAGGDRRRALALAAKGVGRILAGYDGPTRLLLEVAAGAGQVLGDRFEEIREILDLVGDERVGVCLDTVHAFASGYDLRGAKAVAAALEQFDRTIGLEKLALIHANDSKFALGEHRDRHEHIGRGEIGLAGFRALLAAPELQSVNFIVETPNDAVGRRADVRTLKKLRSEAKI